MRSLIVKAMAFGVLLAPLVGCATEREHLEEERQQLIQSRDSMSDNLRHIPQGSRWSDHPDTTRMLDNVGQINGRIGQIDRSLDR